MITQISLNDSFLSHSIYFSLWPINRLHYIKLCADIDQCWTWYRYIYLFAQMIKSIWNHMQIYLRWKNIDLTIRLNAIRQSTWLYTWYLVCMCRCHSIASENTPDCFARTIIVSYFWQEKSNKYHIDDTLSVNVNIGWQCVRSLICCHWYEYESGIPYKYVPFDCGSQCEWSGKKESRLYENFGMKNTIFTLTIILFELVNRIDSSAYFPMTNHNAWL